MANIKSAIKRAKTNEIARMRNKAVRTNLKTVEKQFQAAVAEGNRENAQKAYNVAAKQWDKAVAKHVIHKNKASNKKSQLAKALNSVTD